MPPGALVDGLTPTASSAAVGTGLLTGVLQTPEVGPGAERVEAPLRIVFVANLVVIMLMSWGQRLREIMNRRSLAVCLRRGVC